MVEIITSCSKYRAIKMMIWKQNNLASQFMFIDFNNCLLNI